MADQLLTVEVIAKMDALSVGLKKGERDIKSFVDASIPGLTNLENMLKSLGISSAKGGLDAIAAATKRTGEAAKQAADELGKHKKTILSNSQAEIDAYNQSAKGSILYTSAINGATVARARLNAEAAKSAIANGTLSSTVTASTYATDSQTSATNTNVLSKKQLAQMLAEEKLRQQQSTSELKNNAREMLNAKGSLEQRRAALIRLTTTYDRLSKTERESASGSRMAGVIKGVSDQVKALEAATGRAQRNVGNYGDSVGGLFKEIGANILGVIGPLALFTAAVASAKEVFSANIAISDNFVDVQRTAKMSGVEVDELGNKLKAINTRTDLTGLLDIGFEGGRLGVQKEELVGFITTIDELAVVLKKELPGGAEAIAESLGKVAKIYKVTENEGVSLGDAMNKVGSGFLELAHSGGVTVKYLQDFTLGVAGTAVSAKLSLPVIAGYGAVLSNAGTIASSAAISMTRLVNDLSTKRGKYFAIAQLADSTLTLEKFNNTINTDTKAALDMFFAGLKSGNPSQTEFSDRIKSVGITTGKVSNAVKVLANNYDLLAGKTEIATKGFDDGTSVAHNFELANNSLSASFDKIKNAITNAFTDSAAQRSLATLLNAITDNRTETEKLTQEYANSKHSADELENSLNPLVKRYDELTGKASLNKVEQEELRDVTSKIGDLLPGVTTKFDDYGRSIDINRQKVTELSKAQRDYLELQNRSAIQTARQQFNSAHSQLPDAKKEAVNPNSNRLEQLLFNGGKKTTEDLQGDKDRITRLSATAYEGAKAIRELGGVLTDTEKKVIAYNEAITQAKKPVKKKAEIIGTGEVVEDTASTGRTTDDIKQDIKDVIEANKKLAVASSEFKANVVKLKGYRQELKLANGGTITPPKDVFVGVESQLRDFQNKSNLITKEGLGKDLQEWDDKYGKIRAIIAKMPAGKRKAEATATLDANYKDGRANIVAASTKDIVKAIKKRNDEIALEELDGSTREIEGIKKDYFNQLMMAEENAVGTVALTKQMNAEIEKVKDDHAKKDLATMSTQIAEIAKDYRQHQAEMFNLAKTDGYLAVEVAENEKAKEELKQKYADRLIDFAEYQKQMAVLIDKGKDLDVKMPKLDVEHFKDVAAKAKASVNETLTNFVDTGIASTLADSFNSIGSAIAQGGNIISAAGDVLKKAFASLMSELGKQFITMGAARIAAGTLELSNPITAAQGALDISSGLGLVALGSGLALGGGIIGSLGSKSSKGNSSSSSPQYGVPHFASGGIVSGPTLAMVGEYPGAKHDPEIISPLSKLKGMIGNNGGNSDSTFIISNKIHMGELVTAIERQKRNDNRG